MLSIIVFSTQIKANSIQLNSNIGRRTSLKTSECLWCIVIARTVVAARADCYILIAHAMAHLLR